MSEQLSSRGDVWMLELLPSLAGPGAGVGPTWKTCPWSKAPSSCSASTRGLNVQTCELLGYMPPANHTTQQISVEEVTRVR